MQGPLSLRPGQIQARDQDSLNYSINYQIDSGEFSVKTVSEMLNVIIFKLKL